MKKNSAFNYINFPSFNYTLDKNEREKERDSFLKNKTHKISISSLNNNFFDNYKQKPIYLSKNRFSYKENLYHKLQEKRMISPISLGIQDNNQNIKNLFLKKINIYQMIIENLLMSLIIREKRNKKN